MTEQINKRFHSAEPSDCGYNPVEAGFVVKPEEWLYSSASSYAGMEGIIEIDFID